MRALVDIVQKLTNFVRFAIDMFVLLSMGIGLMLTVGGSYIAPKAVDLIAERAERAGNKAFVAVQRERIAEDMAKDGWGYGAATASAGHPADSAQGNPNDGGWAE